MATDVRALRTCWGDRIRIARARRRLSQRALAQAALIDQATMSRIERGLMGSSDEVRLRIAAALDVPFGELFDAPELDMAGTGS
ncbi:MULTISPECIES: helix-turn-helix domain-containing protein [Protofrankia]|nr:MULTISPECIES: helix-turn-helix transcriptional regulator [Protofrankia]